MYKANDGRGNYAKSVGKAVNFVQDESAIERRERLLAEKAERDAEKKRQDAELNAWKFLVNQDGEIVF